MVSKADKTQPGTGQTIDDRIKRVARKFLSDMALTKDGLQGLRNYFWAMSDYFSDCGDSIDRELRKRRRTNPKWKRDRPKPSEIRDLETRLKLDLGRDPEKLELAERFLSWLPKVIFDPENAPQILEQQILEQTSDTLNGTNLQKIVRVITRGKSGRPTKNDDLKPLAYAMQLEGKTVAQIAHALWPDEYRTNPTKARGNMKSILHRYKKRLEQESATQKNRGKNPATIL
jgi:hypothetical protein